VSWSPWLETDKAVIEKIQKRAVSMLSGLKGKTYEEKLLELGSQQWKSDDIKQI
jgi:hypothetical protein